MSSYSRVLYVGMTSDLGWRVEQHRFATDSHAFTSRYRIGSLVYYEEYQTARQAINRETQVKAYRRSKKIRLIESMNPTWRELAPVIPSVSEESGRRGG